MANHVIPENVDFSVDLRVLETTDPGHADIFNPLYERLIKNDAYLKNELDILQTDVTDLTQSLVMHLVDYTSLKYVSIYRTGKDANGIFTTIQCKRKDTGTLFMQSVLSGGTSPAYATRTENWYAVDGVTVTATLVYTLSFDSDGDYVSEV